MFALPETMLQDLREGSSMRLVAATAVGWEGDNLLVKERFGAPYQIHPAYVVVPRKGRLRRGNYVIASYGGSLRHSASRFLAR